MPDPTLAEFGDLLVSTLGRIDNTIIISAPPSPELGYFGAVAIDIVGNRFYGPKDEDGWGAGLPLVGPSAYDVWVAQPENTGGTEADFLVWLANAQIGVVQPFLTAAEAARDAAAASATAADSDATATAADRVQTGLDRTAAAGSAVAADADATATAADRVQTGLDRVATGEDATATAADRVQTGLDRVATDEDTTATAADRVQTGLDRVATGEDATAAAADRVQTGLDRVATGEDATATAADRTASEAVLSSLSALAIGTVTEVDAGQPAAAAITGEPGSPLLDLTIPRGRAFTVNATGFDLTARDAFDTEDEGFSFATTSTGLVYYRTATPMAWTDGIPFTTPGGVADFTARALAIVFGG